MRKQLKAMLIWEGLPHCEPPPFGDPLETRCRCVRYSVWSDWCRATSQGQSTGQGLYPRVRS